MGLKKLSPREENKVKGEFPEAYFIVNSIKQENGKVFIHVKGFVDKIAANSRNDNQNAMPHEKNDVCIFEKSYNLLESTLPNPTMKTVARNTMKHCCYLFLKNQDEFRNSTDVLEDGQTEKLA
jgi:hypothetical protein